MSKKTSELLQEVKDYCRDYNIECANANNLIDGSHFNALDKAVKLFKRLEELGVADFTTINLVKTEKWARLEFTINESEEKQYGKEN